MRLLRPYIPNFGLRITTDTVVVNLPLHDVITAAKFQAYDRLVKQAPPNAKADEWVRRRNQARDQWFKLLGRYHQRSSRLIEPGKSVWVA